MQKTTKTEKILRKATSKWEKFLAEGAFKKAPVNEMTMGERGMVDAQDGNPPSKIGHGDEEYMAAFNAVMQKMGKEPLPIVKPDQAYLDALRSGQLEEGNAEFKVGDEVIANGRPGTITDLSIPGMATVDLGRQGETTVSLSDIKRNDMNEKLSAADKEWHKSVMDKGKVANLKGDMGPIPGLEGPVQYRSGAVLYYDPQNGQYYDRGKDMYLDRKTAAELTMENVEGSDGEEADNLVKEVVRKALSLKKKVKVKSIKESWAGGVPVKDVSSALKMIDNVRFKIDDALDYDYELKRTNLDWEMIVKSLGEASHDIRQMTQANEETMADTKYADRATAHSSYSSDPEFDQVHDIAMDSMESGSTGRVLKLDLGDISKRLSAQSFDIERAQGGLVIDDKYQIGLMRDLPKDSRRQIGKTPFGLSYVQDAPSDALPKQAGMGREINEAGKMAAYRITFNDKVNLSTIQELTLELLGVGEQFVDKSKEGYAEISATPKGIKRVVDAFKKNNLPTDVITNAQGEQILELFGMFGGKKKKIEAVKKAMVAGGIPEDKVEKLLSDMAEFLADHDIEPAKIEAAVAELMKNPKDHMGGVPGKALLKALGWNAHKRKFVA